MAESIHRRILRYRKYKGYSQQEMADKLKISRMRYARKENGGTVDCDFLIKITEILDVDANTLLFGTEPPVKPPPPDPPPTPPVITPESFPDPQLTKSEKSLIAIIRNISKDKKERIFEFISEIIKER